MALVLLVMSFTANAALNPPTNPYGWVAPPTNTTDINLQTYYISKHDGTNKYLDIWFYNTTEHLGFVRKTFVAGDPKYGKQYWHMYSNKTKIGDSYYRTDGRVGNKFMCPDGHSATVKRHISILTQTFPRWVYLPIDTGTNIGKPCGYTPPANQTTLESVQAYYPGYQVTRIYPNEDIFKVYCPVGACNGYQPWTDRTGETWFLSNMTAIGHIGSIHTYDLNQYVRVPESVGLTQTARDDIAILANNYLGGYVTWVYDASPTYIRWW